MFSVDFGTKSVSDKHSSRGPGKHNKVRKWKKKNKKFKKMYLFVNSVTSAESINKVIEQ